MLADVRFPDNRDLTVRVLFGDFPLHYSLLIILDNIRRTNLGAIRIFPGIAKSLPLPEKVPTLIQLYLHPVQSLDLGISQVALRVKVFLFVCQLFYVLEYLVVVHWSFTFLLV